MSIEAVPPAYDRDHPPPSRPCDGCGVVFTPRPDAPHQRFHDRACKLAWHAARAAQDRAAGRAARAGKGTP